MKIKSLIFCLVFLLKLNSILYSAKLDIMPAINHLDGETGCKYTPDNRQEFQAGLASVAIPGIKPPLIMDNNRICSDSEKEDPDDFLDSPDDDDDDDYDNSSDPDDEE